MTLGDEWTRVSQTEPDGSGPISLRSVQWSHAYCSVQHPTSFTIRLCDIDAVQPWKIRLKCHGTVIHGGATIVLVGNEPCKFRNRYTESMQNQKFKAVHNGKYGGMEVVMRDTVAVDDDEHPPTAAAAGNNRWAKLNRLIMQLCNHIPN